MPCARAVARSVCAVRVMLLILYDVRNKFGVIIAVIRKNMVAVYQNCAEPHRFVPFSHSANSTGACAVRMSVWMVLSYRSLFAQNIILLLLIWITPDDSATTRDACVRRPLTRVSCLVCMCEFYVFRCDNLFRWQFVCCWHIWEFVTHAKLPLAKNARANLFDGRTGDQAIYCSRTGRVADSANELWLRSTDCNCTNAFDLNIFQLRIHKSIVRDNNNT